jgi:hypothetical protein
MKHLISNSLHANAETNWQGKMPVLAGSKKRQFYKKWEFLCTKLQECYWAIIASRSSAFCASFTRQGKLSFIKNISF